MSVRNTNTNADGVVLDVMNTSRPHRPYMEYPQGAIPNKSDFVYVNNAYNGSVNSVNSSRLYDPPTTVIREQYWACSKWSFAQRILALAVGVLLGMVISLVVIIALKEKDTNITDILRETFAPD